LEGIPGHGLACPVDAGGGDVGIVIFLSAREVGPAQRALAAGLSEPLSAALATERRLHEVETLRETAEADRRALLNRLGRRDMADSVVGADAGLRAVMDRVELVARSDVPVLILGETGTGKELVSRAIHTKSARGGKPFIRVNCGAIPPELL